MFPATNPADPRDWLKTAETVPGAGGPNYSSWAARIAGRRTVPRLVQ